MDHRSGGPQSVLHRILELSPVALVTGILVGTYFLPEALRRSLTFQYTEPTLLTAYTAHFVHFSASHLAVNLGVFVVASVVIFHLFDRSRSRWVFFGFLVTLVAVFPILLSMLNLAVPRNGITYGFSGLNMALVGFLPIAVVKHAESRVEHPIDTTFLLAAFFLSVSYVAVTAIPRTELSVAVAATAIALGIGFATWFSLRGHRSLGKPKVIGLGSTVNPSIVLGFAAWIVFLSLGFPDTSTADGSVVNIYVHFVGYVLGFMSAYLAHEWRLFGGRPRQNEKSVPRNVGD